EVLGRMRGAGGEAAFVFSARTLPRPVLDAVQRERIPLLGWIRRSGAPRATFALPARVLPRPILDAPEREPIPLLTTRAASAYCGFRSTSALRKAKLEGRLEPAGRRGGRG